MLEIWKTINNYPDYMVSNLGRVKSIERYVDNLEWCDQQYNNDWSISKKVLQFDKKGKLLNTYQSTVKAAKAVGADPSNICRCCNGKIKTSKGYVWKYA